MKFGRSIYLHAALIFMSVHGGQCQRAPHEVATVPNPAVHLPYANLPTAQVPESGLEGRMHSSKAPLKASIVDQPPFQRPSVLDTFTTVSASSLGSFPPTTKAERELEQILAGPDSAIDIATVSYLIASDLPEFNDLSRLQFDDAMNRATEHVAKVLRQIDSNPRMTARRNSPHNKVFDFCNAVLTLGMDYNENFKATDITPQQSAALYRDASNIFLPGLLASKKGSCVSMPMLYLCIGRRLGLPVHLVSVGKHSFVRWEEPGLQLNIETTIVGKPAITDTEEIFLQTEGMTKADVAGTDWLRNLTNREIVGTLLHARGGCYYVLGPAYRDLSYRDCARAAKLAPDNLFVRLQHELLKKQLAGALEARNITGGL